MAEQLEQTEQAPEVVDEQDYDVLSSVPPVTPDRPAPAQWDSIEMELCGCSTVSQCPQHRQVAPRPARSRGQVSQRW